MTDKDKLQQISLSLEKFQRTGDAEHLEDIERVLEYDGIADFEERLESCEGEWRRNGKIKSIFG